ncbi:MAG: NTP transferase domain-containing protein, partial [Campylobacterales bacterium]|nr:NTP transferase domain-containing protein [Campylobacterales bacterium]
MKKTSLEDRIDIPCLILCGGKSSRMKENKALLPFGEEKTLMEYQYKKFQKIFSKVYLVVKKDNSVTFTKDLII